MNCKIQPSETTFITFCLASQPCNIFMTLPFPFLGINFLNIFLSHIFLSLECTEGFNCCKVVMRLVFHLEEREMKANTREDLVLGSVLAWRGFARTVSHPH
jgi:hypothetical protein